VHRLRLPVTRSVSFREPWGPRGTPGTGSAGVGQPAEMSFASFEQRGADEPHARDRDLNRHDDRAQSAPLDTRYVGDRHLQVSRVDICKRVTFLAVRWIC
jgi:hypothetical protein